jgi:hypothetical protein
MPDDVTPHVLRHSFASLAADMGQPDHTIFGLLVVQIKVRQEKLMISSG